MTTTTVQKWGNSQGIRISKKLLQQIEWAPNQAVKIIPSGETLIIKKASEKNKKSKSFSTATIKLYP